MVEELQQFDFTNDAFSVNQIFEGFRNFLDCNFDLRLVVVSTAHDTIRTMADLLDILILVLHKEASA